MAYPISDVPRRIVYSGSAGVGPYAFTFEVLANTDIAVYKNTTLLTLTTDYTVSINTGTGTGTVTLVVAATGADTVTIVGDRAIRRTSDFVTGGDLFANTLNEELDAQTIYTQQVDEKADRAIKIPVTDPTNLSMTLPSQASRAQKLLGFNASGEPTAYVATTTVSDTSLINFTQAGTGAVTRTAQAKMRDTVSVKDFGAVGDGVADDTAEIQAALATVSAGGGVYFPAGTYRVTALLTIPAGVIVYGDGMTATRVRQEGAAYCFALGNGAVMRDMRLDGSASATGGININNCGLGQVENVRIEGFNAASAIGIRLNESYRIKLSYLYIYDCYNGLSFTGNVTAFEFDKGNVATNNASGKAINAAAGGSNSIEAYFNTVYFESCYGSNPIFVGQTGRVVFTACGFEAMCVNPGYTGTIANPAIIRADNPTELFVQNCQFSGFLSQSQTYSGTLSFVYMGDDAPICVISSCSITQNQTYAGLTLSLVRSTGKNGVVSCQYNTITGSAFTTINAAEAILQNSIDLTYNPLAFSAVNNRVRAPGVDIKFFEKNALLDSSPPSGTGISNTAITASGASTTVYTRTWPARYFGLPKTGLKITAWGKRTGTAGTKRALLEINAGGTNSVLLAASVTAADDWRGEAILFWRSYNVLSINTQLVDGAAVSTSTSTFTRDWSANTGTISITLECAGGGDTMTLEGMIMERF